ncbi:major facilitator superfamily domain-containing protein [Penicillium malachiteum]|uniref:major facilitator superfamily domain-containing protein n=1 Tax=Penicillium malachiteum TaxID=1324776 RepID=UPI0025489964|nr:major facilitator superfamily domain-containing protein [Penicillium malachiteum]KAJ5737857.1 major facilitator superfamily domain-containing protein [Penicillium malachiteum]
MESSPTDSAMKMEDKGPAQENWDLEVSQTVKKQTSKVLNIIISGLALFSDGYNAQIVGYMDLIFTKLYKDSFTTTIKSRLTNSYLIGEIFGMLLFGALIDRMGRRTGVILATILLVLGVVLATAAHGTSDLGMFWMMIIARGVAGVGAGGEYPVCGTSTTEAADESHRLRKRRGLLVGMTTDFAVDFGIVSSGVVAVIVLACYGKEETKGVWRICFGLGFVLPLVICFFRVRMINSTQWRKHSIKSRYPYLLVLKRYWKPMVGTSLAWFCYDFVTYPFGLFSSTIVQDLMTENTIFQSIGFGAAINLFLLPGCIIGAYLMDKIGQMGPGVATFLCAAESFPTPLRGHFLGLAAAFGKAGGSIGTQVFTPIQNSFSTTLEGQRAVFLIGSGFAMLGGSAAWFLIPDMSRELETEDARFKAYLVENGYDITNYGEEALVVAPRE